MSSFVLEQARAKIKAVWGKFHILIEIVFITRTCVLGSGKTLSMLTNTLQSDTCKKSRWCFYCFNFIICRGGVPRHFSPCVHRAASSKSLWGVESSVPFPRRDLSWEHHWQGGEYGGEASGHHHHHQQSLRRRGSAVAQKAPSCDHLHWRGPGNKTLSPDHPFEFSLQVIHSDPRQGWTGFLPFGFVPRGLKSLKYKIVMFSFSQELWLWLAAAYPKAVYCLSSATLTDEAVLDIRGSPLHYACRVSSRLTAEIITNLYSHFQPLCASNARTWKSSSKSRQGQTFISRSWNIFALGTDFIRKYFRCDTTTSSRMSTWVPSSPFSRK